jgi:hypothetical protein
MIISHRFATRRMECPGAFAAFSNDRCCSGDRQLWMSGQIPFTGGAVPGHLLTFDLTGRSHPCART